MKIQKSKEQLVTQFKGKRLSPLQAIKNHCRYECCVNDVLSWKYCNVECLLKPFRFGHYHSKDIKEVSKEPLLPINFDKNEASGDKQEQLICQN